MLISAFSDLFTENDVLEVDDVIQPSSLRDYTWPETDPSATAQPVRCRTEQDIELVMTAASAPTLDLVCLAKNTRGMSLAEKVYYILAHQKFQINPAALLRKESLWKTRIEHFVQRDQPIFIVYPLMCKIGNWAKQMRNVGPTAGEEATVFFFRHLNDLVKTIYPPGLLFAIVSDAALYNSAFCNPQVEVSTYMAGVQSIIQTYGSDFIRFYDYAELLSEESRTYSAIHHRYQRQMCDDPRSVLDDVRRQTLFESVKASINIRKFGMTYQDMRELFSFDANRENRYWSIIDTMTRLAMEELVAIRKTCMEINYFEKRWPQHVRVSCHKDQKGGRWVIGLKPYPEYYGSSRLLPYHGVPVLRNDCKTAVRLDIVPEVMLRGRLNLVRVENAEGDVYCYDATGTDDPSLLEKEYRPLPCEERVLCSI